MAEVASSVDAEELSPEEIIGHFKTMKNDIRTMTMKVEELEAEFNEHQLVMDSISTMEPARKAWRLVGGVLIQQTVGEVLPAISTHQEMIKKLLETVTAQMKAKEKESTDWKLKYNIQTQQERELQRVQPPESAAQVSSSPGVLA
mmetsp:Transcript_28234/g.63036  ORF Transcript_28234/g.63036 Transcript_28234/m.63036 type:complete len:145 (-) Transcript_28234:110-544(-)